MKFRWWFVSMGITSVMVFIGMLYLENFVCLPVEDIQCVSPSPQITTVIIPQGSENQDSGKNYEPRTVTVVIGVNNTVKWINKSPDTGNSVVSDLIGNESPQSPRLFDSSLIMPEQSYEFTFTQAGTYHYHGEPHPWQTGTIIVLPHQ